MSRSVSVPRVAVVGGANVDIGGRSRAPLRFRDSNPGAIRRSYGGVGRNIAHNLRLLGLDVGLLTALGCDEWGRELEENCRALGLDLSAALRVPELGSSVYLYLADYDGDMTLAVSDMEICERLTADVLRQRQDWLTRADAVAVDANLPAEALNWLCENCAQPIYADPVSVAKAEKLRPVLGRLDTLKPNRPEAELLSGVRITDEESLNRAADALLKTGLRRVVITMGARGVLAAGQNERVRLPAPQVPIVSTTGCGDAFLAALVWAGLQGLGLEQSARTGLAAAAVTLGDAGTVSECLNAELLRRAV